MTELFPSTELVTMAKEIITPGQLTYGGAKRMLDLIRRHNLTGGLTSKQKDELSRLIHEAKS